MTVDEAIVAKLTDDTSNTHPLIDTRIYPGHVPDTAILPHIMYERKNERDQATYNIDGTLDHARAVYQLHCISNQEDYGGAIAIAEAVRKDLTGHSAALQGVTIHRTWWNRTYGDFDGVNKRHRVTVEIELLYT